jgi:putative molybdopterin biosynthesis protein
MNGRERFIDEDMILSKGDSIMSTGNSAAHRLATLRKDRGWSQGELADRAGVPRTTLGAIEGRRLTPSVTAALAVARALGGAVEDIFGDGAGTREWAWTPAVFPARYWEARVGSHLLAYPVESLAMNAFPHDGVATSPEEPCGEGRLAADTLVIACCDPAAGLLAAELARSSGVRLLVIERGGLAALDLLRRGLVHAAGLHFSTTEKPDRNREIVQREAGAGYQLLRAAAWSEGLALAVPERFRSTAALVRGGETWALREVGSAARDCLDDLFGRRRQPEGRIVRGHAAVAGSIRAGWAGAGVCVQLSAVESGLSFRPLRTEFLDLCVAESSFEDHRVRALLLALRSRGHRRVIGDLPGYDSSGTGTILTY